MKTTKFLPPNYRCIISKPGRSGRLTVLDYAANADELRRELQARDFTVHAIEPYDFSEWLAKSERYKAAAVEEFQTTRKVTFSSAVWSELKHHLFRLFEGCAYCEVKVLDVEPGSVEHYRPKGRVEEDPSHPGYYWLAYEVSNWFPACSNCNEVAKGSHFPLVTGSPRAYHPGEEVNEKPLLLCPNDVDLDRDFHFTFAKRGISCRIKAKNERAEATIKFYGLNRGELSLSRGKEWVRAQVEFLTLVLALKSREEARKTFEANLSKREFSAASRAAIKKL